MSPVGTKRRIAAVHKDGRYQGEADIDRSAAPAGSDAFDPKPT
jgi:hypothetical protein